jgi:hypothetical protein
LLFGGRLITLLQIRDAPIRPEHAHPARLAPENNVFSRTFSDEQQR